MRLFSVAAWISLSFFSYLFSVENEETLLRRVHNHLLIQDYDSACRESQKALAFYPASKFIYECRIKALAKAGDEKECLAVWKEYARLFPEDKDGQCRALEEIAWGVIHKTAESPSPLLRMMGVLAAFLSQDAKGIEIMKRGLRDSNLSVRGATVKLVGNLQDACLQDEIERLVLSEKAWKVRLEAIKAAGVMKLKRVRSTLLAIAADPACHALERAAATTALVQMQKAVSRQELERLVQSKRAGMRMLACEIVAHLELSGDTGLLMPLLRDYSAEVRARALLALGLLRIPIDVEKGVVVKLLDDPDPSVAIAAAWVVALSNPEIGQKALGRHLQSEEEEERRLAAGALVAAGPYGFPLAEDVFDRAADPYVRLNMALALIGQRKRTEDAARVIFDSLTSLREPLMEKEGLLFSYFAPSDVRHDEMIPNAPEAINQKTRLELLNVLAVVKYPHAQEAVRQFLKEKKWGMTGIAAAVLLTEGDERAIQVVKELLSDRDPQVRLQAAFVLAAWGGGEDALDVLEAAYAEADFEEKEKIIEGIARVGSKRSLLFFIERLEEPHQSLRLIAAAGLVLTLYH